MPTPKCLLIYPEENTFVLKDINAIQNLGTQVIPLQNKPTKNPILFTYRQFLLGVAVLQHMPTSQQLICWFADYHSLVPLLLARFWKRNSLVIVGGFDAVSDRANKYGIFRKKGVRQWVARWSFRLAKRIWVVDASLREGCPFAKERDAIESGLLYWMPSLANKIEVVPTGYDPDFWKPMRPPQKSTMITVASISSRQVITRKGILSFIELAKATPNWSFTIVGDAKGLVTQLPGLPENVTVMGRKSKMELVELYSKSQVYFQASSIEGLPNVLCEAMLCGCIPMGQKTFGIPEAIGPTGPLFDNRNDIESIQKQLLEINQFNSEAPRERIINKYHQEKRKIKLKRLLNI